MNKKVKFLIGLLALALVLSLSACGQSASGPLTATLDLDYIGEESADTEVGRPWYAWFEDAFSFGKGNTGNAGSQDNPDSVEEFYSQGTETLENGQPRTGSSSGTQTAEKRESGTTAAPSIEKPGTQAKEKPVPGPSGNDVPTPPSASAPENKNTVTMSIRCDTAVNNGMHLESKWAGIVPASGCILDTATYEIKEGDTALDVLKQARDRYKLHMEYIGGDGSGAYVRGINNLYEFDGGRWSGWMYCVNGWYPNYGCGVYYVKPGDRIEWNYTCDLGLDLDGSWWEGAEEWKETHP